MPPSLPDHIRKTSGSTTERMAANPPMGSTFWGSDEFMALLLEEEDDQNDKGKRIRPVNQFYKNRLLTS